MSHRKLSKNHKCDLVLGSDSMLPNKEHGGICRQLKKLTLIAVDHPKSEQYVSYPTIVAERQHHIAQGGNWVIHPYSYFSIIWSTFMVVVNMCVFIVAPMRFSYVMPTPGPRITTFDHVLVSCQIVCLLDILVNFNTGFRTREKTMVLVRRRIAGHYLSRWFPIDLASSLPLSYTSLHMDWGLPLRYQMFLHLLPCLRCLRVASVLDDFQTFVRMFTASYIWRRSLNHVMLFIISIHWCLCTLYSTAMVHFYWYGEANGYCHYLTDDGGFANSTLRDRYQRGVVITCAAFFGTGYSVFNSTKSIEIMVNSCILLYGSAFMIYNLVIILNIYLAIYNSTVRYEELMNQVEKFMRHKQFPRHLKNRVRDFYNYKYQKMYFKEERTKSFLSEQLSNEIALDICHKLIDKVVLFEGLPATLVGSILGCLNPEVFMTNDLILRGGDIGDCMYFIASGTVAVYSLKGMEICHLDDGAHFGEVALLMKDHKRVATVVAIEITQVYRLDAKAFRNYIVTYQELYQRVEAMACIRMHETVLIDESIRQRGSATKTSTASYQP